MSRARRLLVVAGCLVFAVALTLRGQEAGRAQGQGAGGRGRGQVTLPEGAGRPIIENRCVTCHALNMVTGAAGYSTDEWRDLIATMIALPERELAAAATYLGDHFAETPGRQPVLVAGDTKISIKEWIAPTLGQRARDPIQLRDGTIWWVGQFASLVGRLNPATGEMKEFVLDPTARPHSVIADRDGGIWYMGNGNATIGKLDPATGAVHVYKMSDPAARDPHTPYFDQQGNLWFTLQQSNMVGRLVPATGAMSFVTLPTPNARPYGIVVDAKGNPWIAYNGSHKIARVDAATMAVREFPVPTTDSRIRRLDLLSDGTIFYVDAARGYLGRMDPTTGAIKEWPSPSGPRSQPYAIAVVNDVVWYNESGQRPDALVRFDPKTEKFQTWAIPSGVGIIRHMRATPDGNLVIHQSSTNRIGLVTIAR